MRVFNEILVVKLARAGNQFLLPQRLLIAVYQNKSALRVGVGWGRGGGVCWWDLMDQGSFQTGGGQLKNLKGVTQNITLLTQAFTVMQKLCQNG